jgi:uncharacterized membrane protein YfcA
MPLLIGLFRFRPLEAVIVNKAMNLIVVASALPLRTGTISFAAIADQWMVITNLLAGSLLGAWVGAAWATRLRSETLYRVIAVLLVAIAVVLLVGHSAEGSGGAHRHGADDRRRGGGFRHRRRCWAWPAGSC